jgi:Ca-activated chloride channel family protein
MNELWERWDPGFFAPIWLGVGLVAMIAVLLLEIGAQRRRVQAIRLFAAEHLLPVLTGSLSSRARMLKRVLLIAAVGLLFVAMARPHLLYRWSEERRSGLDVFLAIDCSKSMLTEDVNPNRLERAKLAVEDFADQLPNNRLGLIAFAGDAFLECPLTLDHDAFQSAVRDLDTDTIPRPGTDIASAIEEAIGAVKSQPNNLKFLILITDGEDLEGRVLDAAKEAAQTGLKIYTVGVGTPQGGQIPMRDDAGNLTYLHDNNGQVVQSKLDEATLRQIAQITGGAYEPLGQRGEGLETIYQRYIAAMPKQNLEERREKIRFERFEWPLGLGLLFLIWEFLVRERARASGPEIAAPPANRPVRRRKVVSPPVGAVSALVFGLMLSGSLRAATADVAERDYQSGDYPNAAQKYREAIDAQPTRKDLEYNRGDAAYKAKDFTEAEDAYRQALETPDLNLQENTYYNLGNAQFKDGEALQKADSKKTRELWEQALQSYESALKLKDAADTKYNYDYVKKKLDELKQQQQQQQQQKNQQQSGNKNQQNSSGQGNQEQKNQGDQSGANNPQNGGQDQSQPQGQNNQPDDQGSGQNAQQQASSGKNAPAQQRARSGERDQDQQDPGVKSREEAEALLDSLKGDEHRVTARSLNGGNEPPPTLSGKDW